VSGIFYKCCRRVVVFVLREGPTPTPPERGGIICVVGLGECLPAGRKGGGRVVGFVLREGPTPTPPERGSVICVAGLGECVPAGRSGGARVVGLGSLARPSR